MCAHPRAYSLRSGSTASPGGCSSHEITPEASSLGDSHPVGPLHAYLDKCEGSSESSLGREDWQLLQSLFWLILEISSCLPCLEFIVMVTQPNQPSTGLVVCTGCLFLDYVKGPSPPCFRSAPPLPTLPHPEQLSTVAPFSSLSTPLIALITSMH